MGVTRRIRQLTARPQFQAADSRSGVLGLPGKGDDSDPQGVGTVENKLIWLAEYPILWMS